MFFGKKDFGEIAFFQEKDFGEIKFSLNLKHKNEIKMKLFKRKIYNELLQWKENYAGKSALLIQGARRIGKSTIVEEFGKNEYDSYIMIDFNRVSKDVKHIFDDLMNLDYIFLQLQAIYNVKLKEGKSVIIFDEIQNCPPARQAIKYLVQDGRYHYIETGSLISINKNTQGITIPSEEHTIDMYPMDYEEFRWALGDEVSIPLLKNCFYKRIPLNAAHRTMMSDLRLYMLVGGMPQAVNEYIHTKDLSKVDQVKRNIIQLYYEDFMKIDPSGRASRMYMAIPAQLSKNSMRYYPNNIIGSVNDNTIESILKVMEDSKTVLFSYHADDPNVGMPLTQNYSCYKMFTNDTGLFITLAFWDKNYTENIIYKKLLLDKLDTNLGYIYENLVAQMLTASGNKLFYYTFPKDEKHNYEIDFLLSRGNKICPVEVKSSGYRRYTSMEVFCKKYSSRIKDRYLIYTKDLSHEKEIQMIPFYMVPFI